MANVPESSERPHEAYPELAGILDDELARLAEWYRLPIVLCDLQGLSRAEAAIRLGIPEGTLSSRLANGRKKLAEGIRNAEARETRPCLERRRPMFVPPVYRGRQDSDPSHCRK